LWDNDEVLQANEQTTSESQYGHDHIVEVDIPERRIKIGFARLELVDCKWIVSIHSKQRQRDVELTQVGTKAKDDKAQ
jgi:hypothetical protein